MWKCVKPRFTSEQYGSLSLYSSVRLCSKRNMVECSNWHGSAEMKSSIPCFLALSASAESMMVNSQIQWYSIEYLPPCIFEIVEFLSWRVGGAVGLCDWPVALYMAITHICDSLSSSQAYIILSPSLTALKKYLPPSKSRTSKVIFMCCQRHLGKLEKNRLLLTHAYHHVSWNWKNMISIQHC